MVKPAVQLFTLRDVDEPIEAKVERVGETNFRGVELADLDGTTANSLSSALDRSDLDVVGAHVRIDTLEQEYDDVVSTYGALGCDRLVVPTYEQDAFASKRGVDEAADRVSEIASRLDEDGFELLYHNHTFEFEELDGETAFDRFVAGTDDRVKLEVDTGLAKHGGVDPISLIERHADRVSLVHLTDTRQGSESTVHVELGAGEVDLEACVETAAKNGIEWIIYEHGRTTDPFASLSHSDSVLSAMITT
jgi:sugar phosphate isomerase/epimerase